MKTVKTSDLIGFKDLEGLTRIPGSTLRRYVERFPKFLPGKTVDRVRRFSPEVVEVLNRVHALYQEGKRTEEVAGILALEAVATYDLPPVTTDATTVPTPPEVQGEALAYLGPILERLAVALERIADNGARQAAAVEARLARLEALSGDSGGVLAAEGSSPRIVPQKPKVEASTALRVPREEIIARVLKLRAEGLGAGAIATRLRGEGFPTLSGRGQWGKGSVKRVLQSIQNSQSD